MRRTSPASRLPRAEAPAALAYAAKQGKCAIYIRTRIVSSNGGSSRLVGRRRSGKSRCSRAFLPLVNKLPRGDPAEPERVHAPPGSRRSSRALRTDGSSPYNAASGHTRTKSSLLRVRAEGLVCPRLPARPRGSIRVDNVTVDSQTDQLLCRTLLWSALAAIAADGVNHVLWKHLRRPACTAKILLRPFHILGVRTTGILSHTFVPLGRWPALG